MRSALVFQGLRFAPETLDTDCYRGSVPGKIGAQISPLAPGKWLIGVSLPLMGAWITAAALSKIDLFIGPFFWVLAYMLVVGIGLVVWGAATAPINPTKSRLHRSITALVLEEIALGIASFLVFWALVGN